MGRRARSKSTKRRDAKKQQPAIYYSETPVSLNEWREGKDSPKPKPVAPKK